MKFRIIILILAVFALISPASAEEKKLQKTTLRIVGDPKGTFQTSLGTTKLVSAVVEVRNVGDVEAERVEADLIMPNGQRLSLSGPRTLGPSKSASYTTSAYDYVFTTQKLKAEVRCKNCN